ncbi:hypothetical protein [Flavobacterium sp. TSSA_36]|uniref:hypothetical protein n=1 Tax=Flavobacterium sp. TSSA_36 TaxID=3447669 RepID=UPI003F31E904
MDLRFEATENFGKDRIKSCVFSVLADLLVNYFGRYGFQSRAFGVVDADLPRYHSKAIPVKSQETFITFMVCNII